ncbi:NAD-dependent epimerase/dehydratase family protein [Parahaliea mediterranea]|uniref:NAD-dependent epimerase/dehydratase family protein n=1 Tax=Parahaliea mediterranea TaxID=651086 RepID=A0A939DBG5_9GAMM|nr:NAD-dependent epimerase/dehydratase family protein [Parahaliea mediterranea]MBN7795188.1 NAD-dependent epimerase/dehydratase family protein [Parahaliea mediterranea]
MAKKVLVTGSRGFTGRYVSGALQRAGYVVCELGGGPGGEPAAETLDLLDGDSVCRSVAALAPDYVIHLAAVAYVGHGDVEAFYRTNVVGTRNLLAALSAQQRGPDRVVLASSANVYGTATAGLVDETATVSPQNDYAVSKYAMELMSRQFNDRLPIAIARPFNYTGRGQSESFLLPKLVAHFARRAPVVELGNTNVYRDYSDVRRTAQAYVGLLRGAEAGEVYNICSGTEHSIADVLDMLAAIAGYRIQVRVNPDFVRENDVMRLVGSPAKLEGVTGPLEAIPVADTLDWMYRGFAGA